jgi:hypothetical protein
MPDRPRTKNVFFPLAAFFSAAFVLTIFVSIAAMFGDPGAKAAVFLDRYGGGLIAGEVAAILVTGFLALAIDRRQTLRNRQRQAENQHVEKRS